jgi:hypothetical protein
MASETPPPDQLGTPPELTSGQAQLVDFDRLHPGDVVALDRYLRSKEREHQQAVKEGRQDDYEQRFAPYAAALDHHLTELPEHDTDRARAVYGAFADSPHESDRGGAARMIDSLTASDREYGLVLWDRLIRDPNPAVRQEALNQIGDCLGTSTAEEAEPALQRLGITWFDVSRLLHAYIRAEHGTGTADPDEMGELALRRLIQPPSAEPED